MAKGGGTTTQIQDIPKEFKPAYLSLFNSAFGAARTAAGQEGFPLSYRGGTAPAAAPSSALAGVRPDVGRAAYGAFGRAGGTPGQAISPRTGPGGFVPTSAGGAPTPTAGGAFPYLGAPVTVGESRGGGGRRGRWNWGGRRDEPDRFEDTSFTPGTSFVMNEQGQLVPIFTGVAPGAGVGVKADEKVPLAGGPPIISPAYPGPFNAPVGPLDIEALQARENIARGVGGAGGPLYNLGQRQASGEFLDPNSNPAFQRTLEAAARPIFEAFERGRAQIASQGIASGAFKGSSRRGLTEAQLLSDVERNIGDVTATLAFENLARERAFQQESGRLIDEAIRLQQVSPEILSQVGAGYRGVEQLGIEENLRQFEESIEAPFRALLPLASLIQGQNIGSISNRTTAPAPGGLAGGITGALGGGAAGGALANAAGGSELQQILAALAGAGLGGAAGAF